MEVTYNKEGHAAWFVARDWADATAFAENWDKQHGGKGHFELTPSTPNEVKFLSRLKRADAR
jgi:hypothetical protein